MTCAFGYRALFNSPTEISVEPSVFGMHDPAVQHVRQAHVGDPDLLGA